MTRNALLSWAGLAAFVALIVADNLRPENPARVAEVVCAARAVVLAEHLGNLQAAGETVEAADLARWQGYQRHLADREQSIREAGYRGPYIGTLIAEHRAARDSALAAGQADTYLQTAMTTVEACIRTAGGAA